MSSQAICVVLVTAPSEEKAQSIARTLVEERLVACVNILGSVRSIYGWQNETHDEPEVLCLLKTRRELFAQLCDRISSLHPYEVPEILALPCLAVSDAYGRWVMESTTTQPDSSRTRQGSAEPR